MGDRWSIESENLKLYYLNHHKETQNKTLMKILYLHNAFFNPLPITYNQLPK